MPTDDRRTRRTRRLVTAAMTELLVEQPFDRITVQAILDRADIGRATFYAHFRDKLDVVDAIAADLFADAAAGHLPDAEGAIPALALFRHAAERSASLRAMLDTPGGDVFWRQAHAGMRAAIEATVARPGARGGSGGVGGPPPAVRAEAATAAFIGLARWWLREGMPYPPERMAAWFGELMASGTGVRVA